MNFSLHSWSALQFCLCSVNMPVKWIILGAKYNQYPACVPSKEPGDEDGVHAFKPSVLLSANSRAELRYSDAVHHLAHTFVFLGLVLEVLNNCIHQSQGLICLQVLGHYIG